MMSAPSSVLWLTLTSSDTVPSARIVNQSPPATPSGIVALIFGPTNVAAVTVAVPPVPLGPPSIVGKRRRTVAVSVPRCSTGRESRTMRHGRSFYDARPGAENF